MHYLFALLLLLFTGLLSTRFCFAEKKAPSHVGELSLKRAEDVSTELRDKWKKAIDPNQAQLAGLMTKSGKDLKYTSYGLICIKCEKKGDKEDAVEGPFERFAILVENTKSKRVFHFFSDEESLYVSDEKSEDSKEIKLTEPSAARSILTSLEEHSEEAFAANKNNEMQVQFAVGADPIFSDLDVHRRVQIKIVENKPVFRVEKKLIPNLKKTALSKEHTFIEYCVTKSVLGDSEGNGFLSMPK